MDSRFTQIASVYRVIHEVPIEGDFETTPVCVAIIENIINWIFSRADIHRRGKIENCGKFCVLVVCIIVLRGKKHLFSTDAVELVKLMYPICVSTNSEAT